ncbi:MAG: branched-chain amino acid ABC transporter permease [Parafilimonas terrae]|nr:branched-chain amino acid ABC transporter permease [Parafilimonas terrae]
MIQLLFNGLVTGLLIALPALALALTFSVLRFANYAIGAMLTVGAYAAFGFNTLAGWPLPLATLGGMAVGALVAVGVNELVYERLRGRAGVTLLVASIGVALALENVVRFVAGNAPRGYAVAIARPLRLYGLRINSEQITTLVAVLTVLAGLWVLFRFTRIGRAMRAVADNPDLAAVRGIGRRGVVTVVWALSGALAALAGVLIGLDATLDPQMGWTYTLPVFTAAILGGLASPMAAVAGALVLGVAEELATTVLAPQYRTIVAFLVMAVILLVRPSGLFGARWLTR